MGVFVNGKWHEELADPNPNGGSNLTSPSQSPSYGGGGGGGDGGGSGGAGNTGGGGGTYQTKNGTQTTATMAQQLQAVGWGGNPNDAAAVAAAYASTTGGPVTQSGGGGGGDSGQPVAPGGGGGLNPASLAALTQFGSQASGVTQAQLAESKRQFDANLAWQKQMWENQGLPQLVIAQRVQALQEQKYQSDLELAHQAMALQQAGVTGMFNGEPTLAAQQQTFGQHMSLANQGLSYLQAASALQGPQNVFQQSNMFRGAQNNPDVPVFLQALQQNSRLPAFTAQGTPATPLSMGTLAGGLTGQGANPGFNANSSLAAIKQLSDRGPASIAPGGLERLSPDELAALGSGLGAVGNSLPAFLQAYQQSRPQQSAMSGDMSLAA